jgi:hypothetical protein
MVKSVSKIKIIASISYHSVSYEGHNVGGDEGLSVESLGLSAPVLDYREFKLSNHAYFPFGSAFCLLFDSLIIIIINNKLNM